MIKENNGTFSLTVLPRTQKLAAIIRLTPKEKARKVLGRLHVQSACVCRCLLGINNDQEQYKGEESAGLLAFTGF